MIGAVLTGAATVLGADIIKDMFKKDKQAPISIVKHEPFETFAPVKTFAPQVSQVYQPQFQYAVQIESPGAKIEAIKKDVAKMAQKQKIEPTVEIEEMAPGAVKGTDLSKLAVIGAVALIGYGLVRSS